MTGSNTTGIRLVVVVLVVVVVGVVGVVAVVVAQPRIVFSPRPTLSATTQTDSAPAGAG